MIGNPRGYGKSALMMEMAYKRDKICKRNSVPSGPVLFTDFRGVKSVSEAEDKVLQTIQPLFFTLFPIFRANKGRGSTSAAFTVLLLLSISFNLIYMHAAVYFCNR
jgi:hypothetical protein